MAVCEVCQKELKQVNNFHLKKHNMTLKEYLEKYPKAEINYPKKKNKKITFEIDENGCFICTSHKKKPKGYFNCNTTLLHRFVYEECFGIIPKGYLIRHKCDNRYCINPEHLEIGTHLDNSKDMYSRKRQYHRFGIDHPSAKLTEKDVIEIMKELKNGAATNKLAKKYKVGETAIYDIKKGNKWKHLTNKEEFKAVNLESHLFDRRVYSGENKNDFKGYRTGKNQSNMQK